MRLLSGPLSMFGAKAEIAAIEKGLDVDVEMVAFGLQEMYSPKHLDVVRINPKAEIPVLIDDDLEIYESTQIFEYFEDIQPTPALWPVEAKARARARLLELAADEVFFIPLVTVQMPRRREAAGPDRVAEATRMLHDYYRSMEAVLLGRKFLVGTFSYADIGFYMAAFFADFLGQPWGNAHPRLDAWRERMTARKSIQRVAGKMANFLADNRIQVPGIAP